MNNLSNSSVYSSSSSPMTNTLIMKALWRQQQELMKKSPDGVSVIINSEDPLDIQANITGPLGTPYEGGTFRVKFLIPGDFPQAAPKGYFMTKIYHPNVSDKGEICVNTLKKDWNPKIWSLYNVFEVYFLFYKLTLIGRQMSFNCSFSRKFVKSGSWKVIHGKL
jgi:ubiquitin-protein ligase